MLGEYYSIEFNRLYYIKYTFFLFIYNIILHKQKRFLFFFMKWNKWNLIRSVYSQSEWSEWTHKTTVIPSKSYTILYKTVRVYTIQSSADNWYTIVQQWIRVRKKLFSYPIFSPLSPYSLRPSRSWICDDTYEKRHRNLRNNFYLNGRTIN